MNNEGGAGSQGRSSSSSWRNAVDLVDLVDLVAEWAITIRAPSWDQPEAGLMVPELAEGICPVAVLHSLAGVVAHLAAELRVRRQAADRFRKIIHV
jgi:hypothetical protein